MAILGKRETRTVILGQLDREGNLIGDRGSRHTRVDVSESMTPPGAEGFELEHLIDRISKDLEQTATAAVVDARSTGRVRAEIEMGGLREGSSAKAPAAADGDDGLPLMTEAEIRATGEGRIRQVVAEAILRAEDIARRVEEQLRASDDNVGQLERASAAARAAVDRARSASDAQSHIPELAKSQRVEADLVGARFQYTRTLERLELARAAKQALTPRSDAVARFVAGLPSLRDSTLTHVEDAIGGAFKQGYMERMVEIRRDQLAPPKPAHAQGADSIPWYRRRRWLAALLAVVMFVVVAGSGFAVAWTLRGSGSETKNAGVVTNQLLPTTRVEGKTP